MKNGFDSILHARIPKNVRRWMKKKAKAEFGGSESRMLRKWIAEKHNADLAAKGKLP